MIRVHIVDDDPLVRAGLRFILEAAEDIVPVAEAADGQEAVVSAARTRPDVVLMDLRMPGTDGRVATAELAAGADQPRVLALTTFDSDELVLGVLDAGASGYLLKDAPPEEIIGAVRETAAGRTILSPRHAGLLLECYRDNPENARRNRAWERLAVLTDREREVVAFVVEGLTNAEIARRLYCSAATVKAHLGHIFGRLGIDNRVQLAVLGHDAGLAADED